MLQNIHLKGVGPASELSLEFAPRLNLLTGDNGVGKSFVLDIAWWALTGTWAGQPARPRPEDTATPSIEYQQIEVPEENNQSTYSFHAEKWVTPRRMPSSPSLVLYVRVDGSFSVWDSVRNSGRPLGEVSEKDFSSSWAYHFSPAEIWD